MYDECRFWDRSEYPGIRVRRGTAGRAVIPSLGSSSHDLIRTKGAAFTGPRGLGEGELGGGLACRFGVRDDGRLVTVYGSLLMSESGALESSSRRCLRGGALQYEGGIRMGGESVASTGTPTCGAKAARGLLRDGISEGTTCRIRASVENVVCLWEERCGQCRCCGRSLM